MSSVDDGCAHPQQAASTSARTAAPNADSNAEGEQQQQHIVPGTTGTPVAQDKVVTEIVPFLHQLSDHVESEVLQRKEQQQQLSGTTRASGTKMTTLTVAAAGAASASVAAAAGGEGGGVGAETGIGTEADVTDRVRLDAERQILLTMLLAHMCSEHDATPRTFVEQVLRLYEAKVLDSIQFLFDLGFVPRVALPPSYSRAAVVEAVRRQAERAGGGRGSPLALEAFPSGAAAAAADVMDGGRKGVAGRVNESDVPPALGVRILSTSRYRRDFQEEGLIARGSFGDVFRTRHRLDGTCYAIKKVVFRGMGASDPRAQAVMREVQCLAQLDHRNVVRYHTSWLESSWVENGMGHGSDSPAAEHGGAYGVSVAPKGTAAPATAAGAPPAAANHAIGLSETMPHGAVRALAATAAGGADDPDSATDDGDNFLRARLDALVPSHMQSQLIKGLESMVRSSDSASESSQSGWGWGGDSDKSGGDAGSAHAAARLRTHTQGGAVLPPGSSLLRGAHSRGGGFRCGSLSPKVPSPRSPLCPFPSSTPRDRGFSRWSAEDAESETSRWSEAQSSTAGGFGESYDDLGGYPGSPMDHLPASMNMPTGRAGAGAGYRTTVGVPTSSPAHVQAYPPSHARKPPSRRPQTFRHPSIDLDDLVSFRKSSGTAEDIAAGSNNDDSYDEGRDGWRDVGAAGASDSLDVGGRDRNRRRAGPHVENGRHHAQGWARGRPRPRRSVSPDGTIQYPVTLYIQMTLCPGDTLQDWLRKRNARLSSEAEEASSAGTGVGVLIEKTSPTAHETTCSRTAPAGCSGLRPDDRSGRGDEVSEFALHSASQAADDAVPLLQTRAPFPPPPPLHPQNEREDDDLVGKHPHTPITSPRTDPATSESSGGSDETSESCSHNAAVRGILCPPPTREISHNSCGFSLAARKEMQGEHGQGAGESPRSPSSPTRSDASSTGTVGEPCAWRGESGSGRVDLHEALSLFRQLVDGVAHVHSKGILHRDIKPENVFVGEDGCLKIGDFGLSRPDCDKPKTDSTVNSNLPYFQTSPPNLVSRAPEEAAIVPIVGNTNAHQNAQQNNRHRPSDSANCDGHTTGVGTASYASPEQLQGRRYGLRSDLFSLGLILLELCCCFTTTHERAAAFQSMRSPTGSAPSHLAERSPAIAALAELLCRTTVESRPSAADALERLDRVIGQCGCRRGGGSGRVGAGSTGGGDYDSDESGDARVLREELAVKNRIVEEQEVLIGQLQRKLTELSRTTSPALGPTSHRSGSSLDVEALRLGLSALHSGTTPSWVER